MPGFSFSPTLRKHTVSLLLKNGNKLTGRVVDVNPTEIILKVSEDDQRVVRVNRDDVTAYTGEDDQRRTPVAPRLVVTRCCNVIMRCNGVKHLSVERREPKGCTLRNEHCECYTGDFFSMNPTTQVTLLNGVQIGEFPKKTKDDR